MSILANSHNSWDSWTKRLFERIENDEDINQNSSEDVSTTSSNSNLKNSIANEKTTFIVGHDVCILSSVNTIIQTTTIRILSLPGLARAHKQPCIQLLRPSLPFATSFMVLNSTSKLLAVAGKYHVAVVILPPAIRSATTPNLAHDVKIHNIGEIYHADDTSPVVKMLWHPLSFNKSHLMVLTADGLLRMYDVSTDPNEPEQIVCFSDQSAFGPSSALKIARSPTSKKKSSSSNGGSGGVFGIDIDEREAVSFSLGCGDDGGDGFAGKLSSVGDGDTSEFIGWNALSVYGVMKNGDLFAFCPFVPLKSVWSLKALNNLKSLTDNQWKSCNQSDEASERRFYWKSRWLDEAIENVNEQQRESNQLPNDTIVLTVSKSPWTKRLLTRQGPIAVISNDSNLETHDFASDLTVVSVGSIVALAISKESGVVDILIQVSSPTADWALQEKLVSSSSHENESPLFVKYEEIELFAPDYQSPAAGQIKFIRDPKYSDAIYAKHYQGVSLISFHPWIKELLKAKELETSTALTDLFGSKHVDSDVQCLIDICESDKSTDGVESFAIVNDLLLGYGFIAKTVNGKSLGHSLTLRSQTLTEQISTNPKSSPSSPAAATRTLKIVAYTPEITTHFEMPRVLEKSQPIIITNEKPGADDTPLDEKLLRTLTSKIVDIRNDIAAIKEAGSFVQNRVEDVQSEALLQHKAICSYVDVLDGEVMERAERIRKRAAKMKVRQDAINARVDAILQFAMDATQPELNEAEREFFAEVRDMASRVRSILKPRLGQVSKQKQILMNQARAIIGSDGTLATLSNEICDTSSISFGNSQLGKINDALKNEYKLLTETWKKAEDV
ncbi:hypothetical protein HK100_012604, partial [Physocladia obscura]